MSDSPFAADRRTGLSPGARVAFRYCAAEIVTPLVKGATFDLLDPPFGVLVLALRPRAQRIDHARKMKEWDMNSSSGTSDYDGARGILSRYCTLIDAGDLVGLSELFHLDARLVVSFDSEGGQTGRAAILAWYSKFFGARTKVRHPRHKLFEPDLVVSGNHATASAYFDSDFVEPNDNVTVFAGRYDDVLIRERARWYFMERTITIHHHYSPGISSDGMKTR